MADSCPIIGNDGVYGQVTAVMNNMWGNSQQAFSVALEGLDDLGSWRLEPIGVDVHMDTDSAWWHVQRPVAPAEPDMTFDPNPDAVPPPPTGDTGPNPNFTAPPTFSGTAPDVPVRLAPDPLEADPPEGPPALDPVGVPDAPELVMPEFPELRDIVLPKPPPIQLPTFEGERPEFAIAVPTNTFGFDAQHYTSALLDKIKARIGVMIDGQPGLPDAAARAMKDRAFSTVDQQALRAEQEAIEGFAAMGWPEPDGVLHRKLAETRQNNQNERGRLARDIYIKDVDVAIEDLRFAVAQGVALEGQLMSNFLGTQQLMLDVAKATVQIAIEVANAEIAAANLELRAYEVDAQVHRDLIQAELAKVEVYRAQLEGKRLIGELNQQDVAIFSERVRFVLSQVEIYNARVNAVRATADINVARVQAFRETVNAYAAQVEAKKVEWEAYGRQLEADMLPFRRYELETEIFGRRVDIWGRTNQNLIDQKRLRLSEKELDINAYRARLERIDTALRAEVARVDALARVYGSRIEKYRADAALEQIISEGNARPMQLAMEQERARVDTELKNAELRITQANVYASLMERAKEAIAQIGAQLAAGFASAMSVQASIRSGMDQSTSCQTQFRYDGEF